MHDLGWLAMLVNLFIGASFITAFFNKTSVETTSFVQLVNEPLRVLFSQEGKVPYIERNTVKSICNNNKTQFVAEHQCDAHN